MTNNMGRKLTISYLVLFINAVAIASGLPPAKSLQMLLLDGSVLTGVDGRLVIHDSNEAKRNSASERWFFEFDSDFSDGAGLVKAGTRLELLPSSVLERMIADANNAPDASYKLGGSLTQYRGKNFIFPTYFLPLAKTKMPKLPASQKSPQQESRPKINEPNDVVKIPKELLDKLPDRKKTIDHTTRPENSEEIKTGPGPQKKSEKRQDSILADRSGFIRGSSYGTQDSWRKVSFVLDALGRKEPKTSLHLLPCQALEQAQLSQAAAPDTLRLKIAGIVTKFKGKKYLLLQRSTCLYSHGNFPG
ncbi:MAG: hypothetical protein OEW48_03550 [Phycisphaerae bacterium]|nr:hypothetical protein [Phycisphaerae bacterium]